MIGLREILGCSILCICGLAGIHLGGRMLGPAGALVGFLVGTVGVPLIVYGVMSVYVRLHRAGPCLPPCHTGGCRGGREILVDEGNYVHVGVDEDHNIIRRCGCGREYAMFDGGRRFMERLPDGTFSPYMVHRPFRGWYPDSDTDA